MLAVEFSYNISAHEEREAKLEDEVDRVQETMYAAPWNPQRGDVRSMNQ